MASATETEAPRDREPSSIDDSSPSALATPEGEVGTAAVSLGVERWVMFAFLIGAFVTFWLAKNIIIAIWDRFDEPQPAVATAAAALLSLVGAFALYQRPNVHGFAHDVATEYAKITWPTREEAWSHTVVVIVVSAVATLILAGFDLAWSNLTNLLYR